MQLPALGCEIFGTVIVLMSLTVYGLAAEILHPNAQKLWRDTHGGRYVPPTTRTAPCKAPTGRHRPREDCRCAGGGRGSWWGCPLRSPKLPAWWTGTGDGKEMENVSKDANEFKVSEGFFAPIGDSFGKRLEIVKAQRDRLEVDLAYELNERELNNRRLKEQAKEIEEWRERARHLYTNLIDAIGVIDRIGRSKRGRRGDRNVARILAGNANRFAGQMSPPPANLVQAHSYDESFHAKPKKGAR